MSSDGKPRLDALLENSAQALAEAGAWEAREDVEKLAAHVLGRSHQDVPPDLVLSDAELDRLQELLARRAQRVPVEYLTGSATLGGVQVAVGPGVFVPRKHTEPLLAWGLDLLREVTAPVVLDLCTGSAAIALAVAHARPDATVHAVELDPVALEWANRNAEHQVSLGDTRILLRAGDVTDPGMYTELDGSVDLLLANPPFVVEGMVLPPEWQEHQPRSALFSGWDGLVVIRSVIAAATRLLRSGGGFAVEHDDGQTEIVMSLLREQGAFVDLDYGVDHREQPRYTTARKT